MAEKERKGFFTEEQEKKIDELIELKGIAETLDGPAIRLVDNKLLQKAKAELDEKHPGASQIIEEVIDEIFKVL